MDSVNQFIDFVKDIFPLRAGVGSGPRDGFGPARHFSHGARDLYPTLLQVQHWFSTGTVETISIIHNIGVIPGGIGFGTLSQHIGRQAAIVMATVV